ncbi:MAG: NTP transferase domain-containing protein [Erysipelothrix sp.]|nr:NTP transferase domain-containing protein [Erysipelothrix sp.]
MNYTALILAAGKKAGEGLSYKKALVELTSGERVLDKSVSIFLEDDRCQQIVIVTNSADLQKLVQSHDSGKIVHVKGGKTRSESVLLGLTAVSEDVVLIHDGVRPWIRTKYIDQILTKMKTENACVLAVKPKGALVQVEDGYITDIVRQSYMQTQTPQAFKTSFILRCYTIAKGLELNVMDDAELVSRVSDTKIAVVEGDIRNVRYMLKD